MRKDKVVSLKKPEADPDTLTELLRAGARALLAKAVQAELAEFLLQYQATCDVRGRQCVVRNGYLPERQLLTGLGEVSVRVPKTRDRGGPIYLNNFFHFLSGSAAPVMLPPVKAAS